MTLHWHLRYRNDGLRDEVATDDNGVPLYMMTVETDGSAILYEAKPPIDSGLTRRVIRDGEAHRIELIEWDADANEIWHFDSVEQARREAELRNEGIDHNVLS